MKKQYLFLLGVLPMVISSCAGSGTQEWTPNNIPNYEDSTKGMEFYGYSAVSDGTWSIDNITYSTYEDFRTVERFKEYKDVGMTIMFPQDMAKIDSEDDIARAKHIIAMAYEAGIEKTVINDYRIQALSYNNDSLIGEGRKFANEEEMDAYVLDCVSDYKDESGLYGIMLGDEPPIARLPSYSETYKSLRRVAPDLYIQYNINPMHRNALIRGVYPTVPGYENVYDQATTKDSDITDEELEVRYRAYLEQFIDAMGVDYIQYDDYPLLVSSIKDTYLRNLQIAAEVAKEKGIGFNFVSQTFSMRVAGAASQRIINRYDAQWLNNTSLAFGVDLLAYFTYWTKRNNYTAGEYFIDGASFIKRNGSRTEIYDFMKEIIAGDKNLAKAYSNFDYQCGKTYIHDGLINYDYGHMKMLKDDGEFSVLEEVTLNKEVCLVTELKDSEKNLYMYTYTNIVDPKNRGSKSYQTAELKFAEGYTHAIVYKDGVPTLMQLDKNNILNLKAGAGEGYQIIPFIGVK